MTTTEFSRLQQRATDLIKTLTSIGEHLEEAFGALEEGEQCDRQFIQTRIEMASTELTSAQMCFGRLWSRIESAKTA